MNETQSIVKPCQGISPEHLKRIIQTHFDPQTGADFWLDKAKRLGVDPIAQIDSIESLAILGDMTPEDLQARPLRDYIPKSLHHRMTEMTLGQTGATTGPGTWAAYLPEEFNQAFVQPFDAVAEQIQFPREQPWLFVGPSGPHIIAKAATQLARNLGNPEPFSIDMDPRWSRKLPENSIARRRYVQHLVDQCMLIIELETIGVLFASPPLLLMLGEVMTDSQRHAIRGVHYGGMAISPATFHRLQTEVFPNAVHLAGYGNTLLGCCLQLDSGASQTPIQSLDYFPYANRLIFEAIDEQGQTLPLGQAGRLRVSRLDETQLIVRLVERDRVTLIQTPASAPQGFGPIGLRNPQPFPQDSTTLTGGLY